MSYGTVPAVRSKFRRSISLFDGIACTRTETIQFRFRVESLVLSNTLIADWFAIDRDFRIASRRRWLPDVAAGLILCFRQRRMISKCECVKDFPCRPRMILVMLLFLALQLRPRTKSIPEAAVPLAVVVDAKCTVILADLSIIKRNCFLVRGGCS